MAENKDKFVAVRIDAATRKILRVKAAQADKTMGQLLKELILNA